MHVLGFTDSLTQSQAIAHALTVPCDIVAIHQFPDGESRVRLPNTLPAKVIFCRSLDQPNDKLIELWLAAHTARTLGACHLTLVAPYLCYMRQDAAFQSGEAISQILIGKLLSELFDAVITVDPHLHRTLYLHEALPAIHTIALSSASLMAEFLNQHSNDSLLLMGPDQEAAQWVERIALFQDIPFAVATKHRMSDYNVSITLPPYSYAHRHVILIDDIASTGNTLKETTRLLYAAKVAQVDILVTHALFDKHSQIRLIQAGVKNIWSTDSIKHPTNVIKLGDLLADAIQHHIFN